MHDTERTRVVAHLVRGVQAAQYLVHQLDRHPARHAAALFRPAHQEAERLAVDPLHHQVEQALVLAQLHGVHDVGVLHQRSDARFFGEHRFQSRAIALAGEQRLHGDELVEAARALQTAQPDLPHAASRDCDEQLVSPQGLVSETAVRHSV